MVKVDNGLRPGVVEKITVFPYGYSTFLDREKVGKIALSVLNRRSPLDYEDFSVFKSDVTTICFVEHVTDDIRYECSCAVGSKGSKRCVHVLAMELHDGSRERVEEVIDVIVADTVKNSQESRETEEILNVRSKITVKYVDLVLFSTLKIS